MENKYEDLAEEMADYWNTRIIKHTVKGKKYCEIYYGVHEVYYYKDGRPAMWTEEPIRFSFEDEEGLDAQIQQILDAKERTVLEEIDGKVIDTNKLIGEMN
jgi:hypothetical protein